MSLFVCAIEYNQQSRWYYHPKDLLQLGGIWPGQPIPAPGHRLSVRGAHVLQFIFLQSISQLTEELSR